jgi:hypothetical protein
VSNWASGYIEKLAAGEIVQFRPRGNSMQPKIKSGQLCTVEPLGDYVVEKNDIVLCKVGGSVYLHIVSAVKPERSYQISNNRGHVNGWISRNSIYGRLTKIEP